ncbi:MAG: phosphoenolpyruvate hydrolase family protein [Lachnospiraceae bacterium]|nr:phosphoenolpyruvate hydrolase family protein [Lachnospiraceae bacterium]
MSKKAILDKLHKKMDSKHFIVAAGVDNLAEEKCCSESGCDLILLYPTADYQNAKNRFLAGYLAFGNTNHMMETMASDMMPTMNHRNLTAGLNGCDPFINNRILLEKMRQYGFIGIHNYPAISLIDGNFGMNLDNLKTGFDKEIELFKNANENSLLTCGMVRTQKQAMQLVRIGIDVLIFYVGLGEKHHMQTSDREYYIAQDIRLLKEFSLAVRKLSSTIPILFFSERLQTIDEVNNIVKEVKEINGYFLMPVTKTSTSLKKLQLEISQLKKICY